MCNDMAYLATTSEVTIHGGIEMCILITIIITIIIIIIISQRHTETPVLVAVG